MHFNTPCYVIDEQKLLKNLEKIQWLRKHANIKSVLALKCFSTWPVFKFMQAYMDGTTSSSLYEAKLGYEEFGKEVHAYSVAFAQDEIHDLKQYADKVIFNSVKQLKTFYAELDTVDIGLRINPRISYSDYDLADPARQYSRLGVTDNSSVMAIAHLINGVMFHYNCENNDFQHFSQQLDHIGKTYHDLLHQLDWVSLGGGLYFTLDDYPLEKFAAKLKAFGEQFGIQIYLEPGETAITDSASLVTTVLDIVHNEMDVAIVDSSTEAHMLDLLIYQEPAEIEKVQQTERRTEQATKQSSKYHYMIAGKTCLAGDIFGEYDFNTPLQTGDQIHFSDAAGYTMVKMNWFNGLKMPSIVIKRLDGQYDTVKTFNYSDFKQNLG
ncbi:MAG: carboxynorspermidine decarboxylase [gamma proteobacterium symbiont of Taylorina sp.]|nr:carboxynorspermidine decarboxylase [gamma proteobacterium symbiont of Taylorina sp.]